MTKIAIALAAAVIATIYTTEPSIAQQTAGYGPSVPPQETAPAAKSCPAAYDDSGVFSYAAQHGNRLIWHAPSQGCRGHWSVCLSAAEARWFGVPHSIPRNPQCVGQE
jgi:hypothetical protein